MTNDETGLVEEAGISELLHDIKCVADGSSKQCGMTLDQDEVELLWRHLSGLTATRPPAPEDAGERTKALEDLHTAARTYFNGWVQDEADDDGEEFTGCSLAQHEDAVALKAALAALEPPAVS